MSDELLDPSEVRRRILADHREIRDVLERFSELAVAVRTDPSQAETLRGELLTFLDKLEEHMKLEDSILVPALEEADAFGDVRAKVVADHHADDRAFLKTIRRDLAQPGAEPDMVRAYAAHLVANLWQEMAVEERDLLHPDILRDDFVTTGVGG